jgi:hypothetical protein
MVKHVIGLTADKIHLTLNSVLVENIMINEFVIAILIKTFYQKYNLIKIIVYISKCTYLK